MSAPDLCPVYVARNHNHTQSEAIETANENTRRHQNHILLSVHVSTSRTPFISPLVYVQLHSAFIWMCGDAFEP